MPKFEYIGDDERVFPESTLTVKPGDVVEVDTNPHARYFVEVDAPAKSAPVAKSAPITDIPAEPAITEE